MPTLRQRLLDLLAIGRVANLPTVWSNVITGYLLGAATKSGYWQIAWSADPASLDIGFRDGLPTLAILLFATTCAYLFGTFLNDWKDAEFDRTHRPERAIPSGRWPAKSIRSIAHFLGGVSLACFALLAFWEPALLVCGGALLACITWYTAIHKRTPFAILPMGLCRSLLYLLGFFLLYHPSLHDLGLMKSASSPSPPLSLSETLRNSPLLILALAALGILAYVAGLTLAARYESRPSGFKAPRAFFLFLLFLPFLTHTWSWLWISPPFLEGWHLAIPALIGLLPFLAWTVRALVVLKRSIPSFVSRSLAGLCLLDLLAYPGIATLVSTNIDFIDTYPLLLALLPLFLFILALLLQRLAPAT